MHSLKSTSQAIGAKHLFELARDQEQAGKEEDRDTIEKHHEGMLQEFEAVLAEIEVILEREQKDNTTEIPDAACSEIEKPQLEEKLKLLLEALDDYNGDQAAKQMDELKDYCYAGKKLEELLAPVAQKIDEFDFCTALELVIKIREEIG